MQEIYIFPKKVKSEYTYVYSYIEMSHFSVRNSPYT
jgi:hypothetical protein